MKTTPPKYEIKTTLQLQHQQKNQLITIKTDAAEVGDSSKITLIKNIGRYATTPALITWRFLLRLFG